MVDMASEDLVAETNALLKEYLRLRQEDKEQAEKSMAETEKMLAEIKERTEPKIAAPEEVDWDKRMKESQEVAKKRIEDSRNMMQEHREQVMAELAAQTELLREIKAKLEG